MIQKLGGVLLAVVLLLTACSGQGTGSWQEQYDLGVRYLSEGNYEEAILAFTAAIEIDPSRAEAYAGRGGAYIASGETEENLVAALADYEAALEQDEALAAAWLGLTDVYIRMGDYDAALEAIREAAEKTDDPAVLSKLGEMELGTFIDSSGRARRTNIYDGNGELIEYDLYRYDGSGRIEEMEIYWADGTSDGSIQYEYGPEENVTRRLRRGPDGTLYGTTVYHYREDGQSEWYGY